LGHATCQLARPVGAATCWRNSAKPSTGAARWSFPSRVGRRPGPAGAGGGRL